MRISDWSSDVCSSDLEAVLRRDIKISLCLIRRDAIAMCRASGGRVGACRPNPNPIERSRRHCVATAPVIEREDYVISDISLADYGRWEEHTSELQSLMRISYAVF